MPLLLDFSYVLITCIDSGDEPQSYDDVVEILGRQAALRFIEGSILLKTDDFFSNEKVHSIFNGWDTIWFLRRIPTLVKSKGITLTTEYSLLEEDYPHNETKIHSIKQWINDVGDCFGLGDGAGTDCVATNPEYICQFSEWCYHYDSTSL